MLFRSYLDFSKYGVDVEIAAPNFIVDSYNEKIELYPCNSFAAPVVASIICNIIEENGRISINDMKKELKKRASFHKMQSYKNKQIGNSFL